MFISINSVALESSYVLISLPFISYSLIYHLNDIYYNLLKLESLSITDVFEIIHLHSIVNGEQFKMLPNFNSFQNLSKGTPLAFSNGKQLVAQRDSVMFMPLYQKKGRDGYFLIKKIKPFFLNLSTVLRRIKADSLLPLLPGISWDTKDKNALQVNLKVTKSISPNIKFSSSIL